MEAGNVTEANRLSKTLSIPAIVDCPSIGTTVVFGLQ